MTASVMVNPGQLAGGDHTIFVSGNDAGAKAQVAELLKSFGWRDIIDVGDITTARGTEMLLPIWLRLMGALQTPLFDFKDERIRQQNQHSAYTAASDCCGSIR